MEKEQKISYVKRGLIESYCNSLKVQHHIIIFHTISFRIDKYNGKERLKRKDYVEWDNQINCFCLHLYWTDKLYKFNNGISLRTRLHEKYSSDTCELTGMTAHHMDINGNFLLAMKVVNIFKNKFKWEAWI